jgi:phosphoadenosine phosphosulfate reductase
MLDRTSRIRSEDVSALPAAERLAYLRRAIDGSIVFTHGFGIEGQLIFHWICEGNIDIDVVTLDTGRLFPETYQLWAETERHYGRRVRAIYPNGAALERLVAKQGIDGIYESKQARLACCDVRKTRPLDRALAGAAAWITGLRADQNSNRRDAGLVGFDASRGLLKFNPLFDWTRDAVLAEAPPRCSHQCFARQGLRFDRLRAVYARAPPRRTRAQRALVVGTRWQPGMRAASAEKGRRIKS